MQIESTPYITTLVRDLTLQYASGVTELTLEPEDTIQDLADGGMVVTIARTGRVYRFRGLGLEWSSLTTRELRRKADLKVDVKPTLSPRNEAVIGL